MARTDPKRLVLAREASCRRLAVALARQHVTILALSDFSRAMCIFNVDQLKISMIRSMNDRY